MADGQVTKHGVCTGEYRLGAETPVPKFGSAEAINLVVAGGEAGKFAALIDKRDPAIGVLKRMIRDVCRDECIGALRVCHQPLGQRGGDGQPAGGF